MHSKPLLAHLASRLPSELKYRLSALRPVYTRLLGRGKTIKVQTIAGTLHWNIDELTSQTFLLGTYESEMQKAFKRYVTSGATVYDVGAHAGFHSLFAGLLVGPGGQVISFEPNPTTFDSLQRQIRSNPTLPIQLHNIALSDRSGAITMDSSRGSGRCRIVVKGDLNAKAETIDSLLSQRRIPPPDVIKIDVEGHDLAVMLGAMTTLRKHRPVILCDYNHGVFSSDIRELLSPLNYEVSDGEIILAVPSSGRIGSSEQVDEKSH